MTYTTPAAAAWDAFVQQHPRAHFLQLSAWGTLKSAYGWSAERVAVMDAGTIVAGAQMLFRPLPMKLGTMAYIPFGAYVSDSAQWSALWTAVKACASDHGAAFVKWEPGYDLQIPASNIEQWGFRPSPQRIQPPRTIMIDITGDDDTIQGRMNQSTRRNIRKAYKKDVRYYQATTAADLDTFTAMMAVTGERNEFGVHSADYYRMMYDHFVPDHAALILAEHGGDTLAANFVFQAGDTAVYLVGASASKKRKLMASYGVQWEGIRWAQERACTRYDMWGVPDEDPDTLEAQFKERSDGMWGVYRFKRGWGGDVVRSAGAWDIVYNPLVYVAYKTALRVRG
jgi:peptidoglycan pentaglycine glycine transferase (the first glycine)